MQNPKMEILLIEDNLSEADLIKEMLSGARLPGFSVQHVQYLAEGLSLLGSRNFDVVMVDLGLPDSQGVESVLSVRNQSKMTPVIVLTILDDEDAALKLLQMGIQDYLIKGEFNGRLLIRAIRYAVQRKRDDEILRLSEARYRALFRDNPTMIITLDTDWTILSANPFCARQLGFAIDELEGQSMLKVFHEDDRLAVIEQLRRCLQNPEQVYRWQLRKVRKDGSLLWVEETAQAVHDLNGALNVLVVCQDITERKQAEEALLRAKEEWELTFDSVPDLIAILDDQYRIVRANQAMAERLGRRPEECVGLHCYRAIHETDSPPESCPHSKTLLDARGHETEIYEHHLAGDYFVSATPLLAPDGKMIGVVYVARDITEQKRAQEEIIRLNADLTARAAELEALNRELEAFNYTVAHDLRKPLTVINLLCQTLVELCSSNLDEECKGYVQESYNSTLRMNQLIDALLNFSQLGRVDPRREKVDLSIIAQAVAAELKQAEPQRRVTFKIAEGVTLNGDIDLLRVVLDNLFGNAWKYSALRDEAIIEFGVTEIDGGTVCFVRDNGVGFDKADADKLFIPFQCLPGVEECRGFGIGLATVERIIRRHGGAVWAEGEPGKGATFYFTLELY
ncbi:MAG: PAS domain S-box protein [Deltaproteobacteria bacterium]|nr:PAS domain S-box protein [Deltaproteobacteria bacterium]